MHMDKFEILKDIIVNRRAIFPSQFSKIKVEEKDILRILEMANWAPSHKKTEPWRFKIIVDESLIAFADYMQNLYETSTPPEKFSPLKFKKTKDKILKSSAIIAICMKRDPNESVPEWEEMAAVACAVQNLWLSAQALDLAGYWSSPKSIIQNPEFLQLEKGERCLGLFYLGKAANPVQKTDRGSIKDKLTWMR